jgi:5-methylthioadenosine/S-adenosylhomocysteine deaminase
MQLIDTLIAARWVIPIEPAGQVLEDHAVALHQGRIVAVLPEKQARERFDAERIVERRSHVLLPGLVNTHTHAAMSLLRGAAGSPTIDHGLHRPVWSLEDRWLDAEYVRDGAELAIADMLTSGTTCFADMHLFPEATAQAVTSSRIRACIGLPVLDQPTAWADSANEYLDKGLQLHDEYRSDPLITTMLATYSAWAVGDSTLTRVRRLADELELPVTMRINEAHAEFTASGERQLARLERLGLLSPLLLAVHMVHVDTSDMERAAAGGITIAHCPQSNLRLGHGVCPVHALRAHGIALTLGTDGTAGNDNLDLFGEMRTAALLANGLPATGPVATGPVANGMSASEQAAGDDTEVDDVPAMTAFDWLQIATLSGARALGLGDSIGSLVPGKWADLCCIDLARPQTQPLNDLVRQIVHSVSRDQVSDVWVAGRELLTQGELTTINLDDVLRRAQLWKQRIGGSHS